MPCLARALLATTGRDDRVGGVRLHQGAVHGRVDDVSSGCGKKPKKMISAISGPTAHSSLAFRSGMFLVCSRTGPVIVRWYIHRM